MTEFALCLIFGNITSSMNGEMMIARTNNIILHLCSAKTLRHYKLFYNSGTISSVTEIHPLLERAVQLFKHHYRHCIPQCKTENVEGSLFLVELQKALR